MIQKSGLFPNADERTWNEAYIEIQLKAQRNDRLFEIIKNEIIYQ